MTLKYLVRTPVLMAYVQRLLTKLSDLGAKCILSRWPEYQPFPYDFKPVLRRFRKMQRAPAVIMSVQTPTPKDNVPRDYRKYGPLEVGYIAKSEDRPAADGRQKRLVT